MTVTPGLGLSVVAVGVVVPGLGVTVVSVGVGVVVPGLGVTVVSVGVGVVVPGLGVTVVSVGVGDVGVGWAVTVVVTPGPGTTITCVAVAVTVTVTVGPGVVSVGLGDVSVGLGDVSVGEGDVSVGLGDVSVGLGDVSVGDGDVPVGLGEVSVGDGIGTWQPLDQIASPAGQFSPGKTLPVVGLVKDGMMSPQESGGFAGSKIGPVWSPWPLRNLLPSSSTLDVFTVFTTYGLLTELVAWQMVTLSDGVAEATGNSIHPAISGPPTSPIPAAVAHRRRVDPLPLA